MIYLYLTKSTSRVLCIRLNRNPFEWHGTLSLLWRRLNSHCLMVIDWRSHIHARNLNESITFRTLGGDLLNLDRVQSTSPHFVHSPSRRNQSESLLSSVYLRHVAPPQRDFTSSEALFSKVLYRLNTVISRHIMYKERFYEESEKKKKKPINKNVCSFNLVWRKQMDVINKVKYAICYFGILNFQKRVVAQVKT